jgi:hypothetical protein
MWPKRDRSLPHLALPFRTTSTRTWRYLFGRNSRTWRYLFSAGNVFVFPGESPICPSQSNTQRIEAKTF